MADVKVDASALRGLDRARSAFEAGAEAAIRASADRAAQLVRREAPGSLKGSIKVRVSGRGASAEASVQTSKLGALVIAGTKPHEIRPKAGRAVLWRGARHPVAVSRHPGAQPNPFMERATGTVPPVVEREMTAAVDRVTDRIAGG